MGLALFKGPGFPAGVEEKMYKQLLLSLELDTAVSTVLRYL